MICQVIIPKPKLFNKISIKANRNVNTCTFYKIYLKNRQYWYAVVVRRNSGIAFLRTLYTNVALADLRDYQNKPSRNDKVIRKDWGCYNTSASTCDYLQVFHFYFLEQDSEKMSFLLSVLNIC